MRLEALVRASEAVGATRSRLEKASVLAELLRSAADAEVPLLVTYLSGRLPQGRVGVGYATLEGLSRRGAAETASLDVADVDAAFEELDAETGPGSSRRRGEILRALFGRATDDEQSFLQRLLVGELRHGSLEGVMIEAVASAADVPARDVRRAVMMSADLGRVARAALDGGAEGLARFEAAPLRPVRPMLAQSAENVEEALGHLGRAGVEVKLDGARIQVHKAGDEVRVFTRSLNDVTHACPEVVESVLDLEANELILDGEVIALRRTGRPHPFQVTMRRFGRRLDVAAMQRALPLRCFYFDCLWLDGDSLLDQSAEERHARLRDVVPEERRVERIETDDVSEAEAFAARALEAGHEGVMVKSLEAPYVAGARGRSWLKVKSAKTLDLVVLAAEWGSGRRTGWLSNLHLGAREASSGELVMLGKTFKGMTDEMLTWQTERLLSIETHRDRWAVHVRPELVVEIAYNDLQRSSQYPGGVALRFARVKAYREDKRLEEADTMDTIRELFQQHTGERLDEGAKQLSLLPDP